MILPGRSDRLLAEFYAAYHAGPIFLDMDSRGSSRSYSFGLKAIEEKQTIHTSQKLDSQAYVWISMSRRIKQFV